jgi:hypothetical protein
MNKKATYLLERRHRAMSPSEEAVVVVVVVVLAKMRARDSR